MMASRFFSNRAVSYNQRFSFRLLAITPMVNMSINQAANIDIAIRSVCSLLQQTTPSPLGISVKSYKKRDVTRHWWSHKKSFGGKDCQRGVYWRATLWQRYRVDIEFIATYFSMFSISGVHWRSATTMRHWVTLPHLFCSPEWFGALLSRFRAPVNAVLRRFRWRPNVATTTLLCGFPCFFSSGCSLARDNIATCSDIEINVAIGQSRCRNVALVKLI